MRNDPVDSFNKVCEKKIKELKGVCSYMNMSLRKPGESYTQVYLRCLDKMFHNDSANVCNKLSIYSKMQGLKGMQYLNLGK